MIRRLRIILIVLIVIAALALVFEATRPYRPDNPLDSYIDNLIGRDTDDFEDDYYKPVYIELPVGAELDGLIQITEDRKSYVSDDMTLIIPSLELNRTVQAGTTQKQLKLGPGLFEASGMPHETGANVSIAGHRSMNMFYHLDKLGSGDRIQLVYKSYIFDYVFYDSKVVLPTDWSVINEQGFDCCTLITCTPIGEANKRLVVRFKLESAEPEPAPPPPLPGVAAEG